MIVARVRAPRVCVLAVFCCPVSCECCHFRTFVKGASGCIAPYVDVVPFNAVKCRLYVVNRRSSQSVSRYVVAVRYGDRNARVI